jgi:methylated-DNA-[protein]-cysteine S-methyltransferase
MPLPTHEPEITVGDNVSAPITRLTVASPIGALTLFEQSGAITDLIWAAGTRIRKAHSTPLLAEAAAQLDGYFSGGLQVFDLPLAPLGTAYRQRVWQALSRIPYGITETYGSLAKKITSSPRAVGGACGANPIPILIPCHRVLGAGGSLHGYSGRGGLTTKARLLALEGALEGPPPSG